MTAEVPELAIIDPETWEAVQARRRACISSMAAARAQAPALRIAQVRRLRCQLHHRDQRSRGLLGISEQADL